MHVAHTLVGPIERLEEHDEREDRLVGVDARHHRQQSRNVEAGHRAADAAAEPQAAHADCKGREKRCGGDIQCGTVYQRETQGVAYGGKQGDAWKGPHRRVGDGPESDGGDSGEEAVEQNIRHDHSSESLTINKVADKPTAMQTICSRALTSRLPP